MQNKNILIVLKYASFYSYCESIIKELRNHNNLTLCIQDENQINYSKYYIDSESNSLMQRNIKSKNEFTLLKNSKNMKIIHGIHRKDRWVRFLRIIRETLNYLSYKIRGEDNTFTKIQSKYISNKIINLIKIIKLKSLLKILFVFLKLIQNLIPSDKEIDSFIKKYDADIVLIVGANWPTRNTQFSSEIDFVKSSKKLKKYSILHVISWDNLIARGLYHYKPSLFFVWNKHHFNEAKGIHNIPENTIKLIGAPFMDKWFDEIKIKSRELFFNSIGLDNKKPLVTYLGSSVNISKNEKFIVENIYEKLKIKGIQLIVRPHGANADQFKNINPEIKIIPSKGGLPDTDLSKQLMVETIKYSDFSIGINTTAMIDSIILGTPCIAIVKEEFKFNQVDTPHFNKVRKEGIFIEAQNEKEIVSKIVQFDKNKNKNLFKNMNKFVIEFCRPYGANISAGKRAVMEMEKLFKKK